MVSWVHAPTPPFRHGWHSPHHYGGYHGGYYNGIGNIASFAAGFIIGRRMLRRGCNGYQHNCNCNHYYNYNRCNYGGYNFLYNYDNFLYNDGFDVGLGYWSNGSSIWKNYLRCGGHSLGYNPFGRCSYGSSAPIINIKCKNLIIQ